MEPDADVSCLGCLGVCARLWLLELDLSGVRLVSGGVMVPVVACWLLFVDCVAVGVLGVRMDDTDLPDETGVCDLLVFACVGMPGCPGGGGPGGGIRGSVFMGVCACLVDRDLSELICLKGGLGGCGGCGGLGSVSIGVANLVVAMD